MKKFISQIKKIINCYHAFNNKFQISKNSASLSFYMLLSLVSIFIIAIQIITLSSINLESLVLTKIVKIFSENFSEQLMDILPDFSLSGFSIIVMINLFYSASKTINGYNRIADYIYFEIKPRIGWKSRLSAFLMFSMLLILIFFEIPLLFFSNYLIRNVLSFNRYFVRGIQFILELLIIFIIFLILYIYAPPKKMTIRLAYRGAAFTTLLSYLLFLLFVLVINAFNQLGIAYSILTVVSFSLFVLYAINYIVIVGFILNYYGNIFQLKTSFFSK